MGTNKVIIIIFSHRGRNQLWNYHNQFPKCHERLEKIISEGLIPRNMNWQHKFFLKNNSYESALTWMFHLTTSRPLIGQPAHFSCSHWSKLSFLLQSLSILNKKYENFIVSIRLPQYKRLHESYTMQCKPATK